MTRFIKVLASALLFAVEYFFVAIYYPKEHARLALQQGESMEVFQSLQTLRFVYSYLWIVLLAILFIIWRRELQELVKTAMSGRK